MGTELDDSELWTFVAQAPTGMLTTLRRDGWPVTLPVWFAALDQAIYIPSFGALKKVGRIERDQRASFLVESGRAWTELRGVTMSATADILREGEEVDRVRAAIDAKYPPGINVPFDRLPRAVQAFHGTDSVIIRLRPVKIISWDNAKVRLSALDPAVS